MQLKVHARFLRGGNAVAAVQIAAAAMLAATLALALPASAQGGGAGGPCKTWSNDADFDEGFSFNLSPFTDADGELCLSLDDQVKAWPFIGVACSNRGSLVRIAVQDLPAYGIGEGDVVGEYLTSPQGMGRNPSRTTVDAFGNIWVGNRAENSPVAGTQKGSVTRVGLVLGGTRVDAAGNVDPNGDYLLGPFDYSTCEDRDGDGLIKTSLGYPHTNGALNSDYVNTILPWPNTAGADTAGGVSTAEDECITAFVRTAATLVRHVSIDPAGNPWIGGSPVGFGGNGTFEQLDGATGQPVPASTFTSTCSGYGGLVDKFDTIWSVGFNGQVMRADNPPGGAQTCVPAPSYGIGIDPQTNRIWTSIGASVYEVDPNVNAVINSYSHGSTTCQGMTVDNAGNVWVAHSSSSQSVGRVQTDGTLIGSVDLTVNPAVPPASALTPTGVAVDTNGKVWSTNRDSHNVMRVDPAGGGAGAVDLVVDLGGNASPYNYSDMTGSVLLQAAAPQGSWTVTYDGGKEDCQWGEINWSSIEDPGTSVTVWVRASNSPVPGGAWLPISNGAPFSLTGQYLQIQVQLHRPAKSDTFVALCDLTVCKDAGCSEITEEDVECALDDSGDFTYTFDLTNNSGQDVKHIVVAPPSGVTISPMITTLPSVLANGDTTSLSYTISGAPSDEPLCFQISLLTEDGNECCGFEICLDPPCECLQLREETFECVGDGTNDFQWSFILDNLTNDQVHHVYLIPISPTGVSFVADYFNVAVLPPNGSVPLSTLVSGVDPGEEVCVLITIHDANLNECCGKEICFTAPECVEEPEPADKCHLTRFATCCFPQDGDTTSTLTICNDGPDPATYDWSLDSLDGCAVVLPPDAFSPQNGSVNVNPGECVSVPVTIHCDYLYGNNLGLAACLSASIVNTSTGAPMKCTGEVGSFGPQEPCIKAPDEPLEIPFPESRAIEFMASLTKGQADFLLYQLDPDHPLLSLNGAGGGEPIADYVFLEPGVLSPFGADARFEEHVNGVHDVLVFADVSGDGSLELAASVGVRSVNDPVYACGCDLDNDGSVGISDLLVLLGAWGPCDGCAADFNNDGQVNVTDLLTLLSEWGPCP